MMLTLIDSNKNMKDVMKVVKSVIISGLLITGFNQTIEN